MNMRSPINTKHCVVIVTLGAVTPKLGEWVQLILGMASEICTEENPRNSKDSVLFFVSIDLAIFQISLINLVMIIAVKIQDCDTSTHTSELYLDHLKAIITDRSQIFL